MRTPTARQAFRGVMPALALSFLPACTPAQRATDQPPPVAPDERLALADTLREEGRLDEALAELQRAIQDNPTLAPAYLRAGDIHRETGDLPAAEAAYRRATDLDRNSFDAAYNWGLTLQMLARLPEAVNAYLRALALRPEDRDANVNLATAYLQLGEPRQALPYGERAVRVDPDHGPSRVNLGAVYAAVGRHADAVTQYESAAELMDLTPELLLNMADALGRISRHREMASALERMLSIPGVESSQTAAVGWERLGSARFRLREFDGALDAFRQSLAIDPNHFPALNGVAVCLLNNYLTAPARDPALLQEALAALRRSLQINPRQPRIVELLARYG